MIAFLAACVNIYISIPRKPASWLVAVSERSENRGLGGLVDSEDPNLAVRLEEGSEN